MRLLALLSLAFIFVTGCVPITAPALSPSSNAALVFENIRVFDGEQIQENVTVVVQNGVISAVGSEVESIPEGAEIIDGSGKTLLPGLIDAHTHVFSEDALRQALIFGVTTELDMFMDATEAAELRQAQAEGGADDRAELYSAGILATAPGGHGTQFGLPIPTISGPDEAAAFVHDRVAEGSDYIKIVIENGEEMGLYFPTLDQETVTALVEAAHAEGKLAVVHVQAYAAAQEALAAGADALVHIFNDELPDQEFVDTAASSGLFVVPTLAVLQQFGEEPSAPIDSTVSEDPHLAPYLTDADLQGLNNPYSGFTGLTLANAQEAVHRLFDAGVPILAGTDAPNPGTVHGASLHRELVLLTGAGLSPLDALAAATSVTADQFSLTDRGRIAAGKRADLLLVNGDPSVEITATRDIVDVWKGGVKVDRAGYLATLEAQRTAETE